MKEDHKQIYGLHNFIMSGTSYSNENASLMESVVQVQSDDPSSWQNYGNTFENMISGSESLILFDQTVTSNQDRAKILHRNVKKPSPVDRRERPFKCGNCTSAFRSKGDLRSHHKLHTEFRPFSCNNCDKTFKTKQYLQKHKKKCGAPPTGKKRGRPKKAVGSDMQVVSSKAIDEGLLLNESNKDKHNGNNNTIHIRVKEVYKLSDLEREIGSEVIHLDLLKNENGEQISETEMNHIIAVSCSADNIYSAKELQSFYKNEYNTTGNKIYFLNITFRHFLILNSFTALS
ncbi:hypothetical protein Avbf_01067 [Armadillidium vulgare]|nr:hypothetical protein Avbf_01067 [Armadillidium vulgare]